MINDFYQVGGPLLAHSPVYVSREADEKADLHLRRMDYISFIEPRQQGKTSLINQLIGQFSSDRYTFAFRDLMAAKSYAALPTEWYLSLGKWLLRQLDFIPRNQQPKPPIDSASWEDFLAEIAEIAEVVNQRVVIVLDEIGAVPPSLATDFFSVIRSIYTSRQSLSFWQYITFIIAGAFNPKDLIQDATISNFNVDKRIAIDDFTLIEVKQLTIHIGLPEDITDIVAEHIYYWTDGQPYLSHQLCAYLMEKKQSIVLSSVEVLVAEAVKKFFKEDIQHLERIKSLSTMPNLFMYAKRITNEPRMRLNAGLNDKHFRLTHILGVIKGCSEGKCRIRNRIYEQALLDLELNYSISKDYLSQERVRDQIFISYSHKDKKWLDELQTMLSPLIRKDKIKIWADTKIEPGEEWQEQINRALTSAKVAVLLVSPHFLASDFIVKHELPVLLEAAEKEGLIILWIAVSASTYKETQIFDYQAVNDPAKPFDSLSRADRNKALVQVCERIKLAIAD